jgi:hypothetical protein
MAKLKMWTVTSWKNKPINSEIARFRKDAAIKNKRKPKYL